MNINNYRFLVANDHRGNKAMMIVKGKPDPDLYTEFSKLNDPSFSPIAKKLIRLIDNITIKTNKSDDKPCN